MAVFFTPSFSKKLFFILCS